MFWNQKKEDRVFDEILKELKILGVKVERAEANIELINFKLKKRIYNTPSPDEIKGSDTKAEGFLSPEGKAL